MYEDEYRRDGLLSPQTVRNIVYLFLTFPLGLAYFLALVIGLSLGAGLAVILIGIPILLGVLVGVSGLIELERQLAHSLLGARIERAAPFQREGGLLERSIAHMRTGGWWRGLIFVGLKFPLGVATFVLTVTIFALTVGMIFAPLTFGFGEMNFAIWQVNTLPESLIAMLIGFVLLPFGLTALNWLAIAWRTMAEALLSAPQPPVYEKRKVSAFFEAEDPEAEFLYEEEKPKNRFLDQ